MIVTCVVVENVKVWFKERREEEREREKCLLATEHMFPWS